jgi:Sulfatase
MTPGTRRARLNAILLPALLVVAQICLFGPQTIYFGNEAEFSAPFWTLIRPLLLTGAVMVLVLVGFGMFLMRRISPYYIAFLFGLGVVLWIQGNLLVAEYGAFDGRTIDWTIESWRNPYEIALWIVLPLLSIAAARHVAPIAPFASAVLLALQAAMLVASTLQAEARTQAEWRGPSDSMFELSRKQNALHIVLDGFQSDLFHEILQEDRVRLDKSFSGAVFFADHSAAFPTTIVSIPAMLTGTVYRNERPLQRYVRDHFQQGSLYKSLRAGGYRVDSVTEMHYDGSSATHFFRMRRPYVSYREYTQFAAWELADLSLFRHAPHVLRPAIHNDQKWRLQQLFGPGDTSIRRYHSANGAVVLDEFSRRLTPATDEPLYKFLHVGIPHPPVVVNADCGFTDVGSSNRTTYKGQTRCAVKRVAAILDRLKELGLYDSSLIVISSDHGIGYPSPRFAHDREEPAGRLAILSGKAMALLIVKPPYSRGPVRVSNAPTTISDIPATIMDVLGVRHDLPGEPALKLAENAQRVRTFAMYDWENEDWSANYFDALDLMEIRGSVLDGNNWTLKESLYAPGAGENARARGLYELHRSSRGVEYRWGKPNVFLHAPPTAQSFEVTIRSIADRPQAVTVASGDRILDQLTLSDQRWVTLKHVLPVMRDRSKLWIAITVSPSWKPRGTGRDLGVMVRNVKWLP